jgi:hypothetical protein
VNEPVQSRRVFLEKVGFSFAPNINGCYPNLSDYHIAHLKARYAAGWTTRALAAAYNVTPRSIQRYLRRQQLCPGYPEGRCMTLTGDSLCAYCRRSLEVAA